MLGQILGSYTIERELGRGGMGAVYAAVHTLLGRRAAVKVLLAELSRNQDVVQRFFNEARAATAIKHPSIVEIYDFGWSNEGSAYIVMELMEGESLAARLRRERRLTVPAALTVARQIANALAAAHRASIVHRDLKPDNVFLVPDIEVAGGERVKLLDFGIAKLAAEGQVSRTSTGAIMGTPMYMSPEQCEGARHVDHRTDLYALGCMLFEMIAGRVPFVSEGVGGLIGMHLHVPPPGLRTLAADAPIEVESLVARLLVKSPDERYQTADEVAANIGDLLATLGAPAALSSGQRSAVNPTGAMAAPTPPPHVAAGTAPTGVGPGTGYQQPDRSYPDGAERGTGYPQPNTGYPQPDTGYPQPGTGYPQPGTGYPQPGASYPRPGTSDPQLGTSYPRPGSSPSTLSAMASSAPSGPPPRSRRGLWLGLGGLGAAAAVVIAVVMGSAGGGGGGGGGGSDVIGGDQADAAIAELPVDAGPPPPDPLLEPARAALAERRWVSAVALAEDLLRKDPDHPEARAIHEAASRGQAAEQNLDEMRAAADQRKWTQVRELYDRVYDLSPEGDPVREQADAIMNEVRPKGAAADRRVVEKLVKTHQCEAARRRATEAVDRWGDEARPLLDTSSRCKEAARPEPPPPPPSGEDQQAEFERLLQESKVAAVSGQWGKAMRQCEKALRIRPRDQGALLTCAIAACNLKATAKARRWVSRLDDSRKGMARQVCLRNGVHIDDAPAGY